MTSMVVHFPLDSSRILQSNQRLHYHIKAARTRYLRSLARDTGLALAHQLNAPFEHYAVNVVVSPPTARRFDPPNIYPTAKALIDGLTDAAWWEDDDFRHLVETSFRYGGKTGVPKTFHIDLHVTEVCDIAEYRLTP